MGREKLQRPTLDQPGHRYAGVVSSTAASTALEPRGVISLATTSTTAAVAYTLSRLPHVGDEFMVHATTNQIAAATSAPFTLTAASGSFFGSSSENVLTLTNPGDGAHLVAVSTTRWAVVGTRGGSLSG